MTRPTPSSPARARALAEVCLQLGAELGPAVGGAPAPPLSFGDPAGEHDALRVSCGAAIARGVDVLELAGADRLRFLNGLTTCEVISLAAGEGRYGFFTDVKGRVLADVVVLAGEEGLRLLLPAGAGEAMRGHLERYVVADRVEIATPGPEGGLLVGGPGAAAALERAGAAEPPKDAWRHRSTDDGATLVAVAGWGVPAWELRGDAPVLADWLERLAVAGARPVGERALEAVRIEAGRLRFGVDYGPDSFPQESGVEAAVSTTKGCYLGQEIVARIHYLGQVNRLPRGLLLPPGDGAQPGRALSFEGREAGRLTSVAEPPRRSGPIGLALIHRRAAEPGVQLQIEGGGEARVVELPFETGGSE